MRDRYLDSRSGISRWSIASFALVSAAIVAAIGLLSASQPWKDLLVGMAGLLLGIAGLAGGDKWGFTESDRLLVRAMGWAITGVTAGAVMIGGGILMMQGWAEVFAK
jgi:hypothetical protein